jgi:hypothetical protein
LRNHVRRRGRKRSGTDQRSLGVDVREVKTLAAARRSAASEAGSGRKMARAGQKRKRSQMTLTNRLLRQKSVGYSISYLLNSQY